MESSPALHYHAMRLNVGCRYKLDVSCCLHLWAIACWDNTLGYEEARANVLISNRLIPTRNCQSRETIECKQGSWGIYKTIYYTTYMKLLRVDLDLNIIESREVFYW